MKRSEFGRDQHRPLFGGLAKLSLVGGAALALSFLLPLAIEREQLARLSPPDLLSLVYLRLGLAERPGDLELRFSLAQRSLEAGLFDEARALLTPPLPPASATHPSDRTSVAARVQALLLEIAYQAWAATPPDAVEARALGLARWNLELDHVELESASAARLLQLGERCAQTGQARRRAQILGQLALRPTSSLALVSLADAAYLAAGQPLSAAELHAQLAERLSAPEAAEHARQALGYARSAGQPQAALALFQRLRRRFPEDGRVLELGLSLTAGLDDRASLELSEALLKQRPNDAELRRRIAQLSDYTGQGLRALDQYLWLSTHGGGASDAQRALSRARAKSDLELTLALTPGTPTSKPELLERIALHEALGQVLPAIGVLERALDSAFSDDLSLWQLKLQLHLRAGKPADALSTLQAIETRFPPSRALVDLRANLLLSLGRLPEALEVLSRAAEPGDAAQLRQVSMLAWELGDTRRARTAYEALVATPEASEWDYQRLWLLAHEAKDYSAGVDTAFSAWQRFRTPGLLGMAIYSAMAWEKPELLSQLLASAEAAGPHFSSNPAYWQLRIHLEQRETQQALDQAQHALARETSSVSGEWLERAQALAPDPNGAYEALRDAQRAQVLALALATDDRPTLARIYPTEAPRLPARQQVNILYRLGQHEQAAQLALDASERPDLRVDERAELAADARSLTQGMPRQLSVGAGVSEIEGLRTLRVTAGAEYSWTDRALSATVEFNELGLTPGSTLPLSDPHELAIELRGRLQQDTLSVGVVTRDSQPRPLARFQHQFFEPGADQLSLQARVNDRSNDTAALRVSGVEDELAIAANVDLPERFYVNAKAATKAYSTRDREYLGAALTVDAGMGRHLPLPAQLGQAALGVATYVAPRFQQAEAPLWVPDSTTWLGATASVARGELGVPSVSGGSLSYALDVASGWLWPQDALGWWGSAGLGIPLMGGDLLFFSARAGNVLSAAPGSSSFALNASYAVSQW